MLLSDFKRAASRLDGQQLNTLRQNRPFLIHVDDAGLHYTPLSSGHTRSEAWSRVEGSLRIFAETGSLTPVTYHDQTHHSSYFVTVLHHMQERS